MKPLSSSLRAGIVALTAFISPYRRDRDAVRAMLAPGVPGLAPGACINTVAIPIETPGASRGSPRAATSRLPCRVVLPNHAETVARAPGFLQTTWCGPRSPRHGPDTVAVVRVRGSSTSGRRQVLLTVWNWTYRSVRIPARVVAVVFSVLAPAPP
jgi:hypothetical protein